MPVQTLEGSPPATEQVPRPEHQRAPSPISFRRLTSPLGELLLIANDAALTGLYFDGHRGGPVTQPAWLDHNDPQTPQPDRIVLERTTQQLHRFLVERDTSAFELPLRPVGTPFQRQVWQQLLTIPFGATSSYRDVARRIGRPSAARAVAAAVGRNPISIIIPCHRVISSTGALTGYAGGLDRKQYLLELEATAS